MMNTMQHHSHYDAHSPHFPRPHRHFHSNQPLRQHPTIALQEHPKTCNSNSHHRQHRNDLSPPRTNNRRQHSHLRRGGKKQKGPRDKSPSQEDHERSSRGIPSNAPLSPKSSRQCTSIEGGPNVNDVVCCSIFCPKRPKGIVAIQANSTHKGNLLFGALVWNHAHAYKRAIAKISSDPSSTSTIEMEQKRLARSIANKIQARGGRFLVWIKQNQNLMEHNNNGSWHLVDKKDVLNISRYALLKRIEATKKADTNNHKDQHNRKEPSSPIVSETKDSFLRPGGIKELTFKTAYESDDSSLTATSSETIAHILSGMSVGSEDDLDIWSGSPCGKKETKSLNCWDYKLLLPSTKE